MKEQALDHTYSESVKYMYLNINVQSQRLPKPRDSLLSQKNVKIFTAIKTSQLIWILDYNDKECA